LYHKRSSMPEYSNSILYMASGILSVYLIGMIAGPFISIESWWIGKIKKGF